MENHVVLLVGNRSALQLENLTNIVQMESLPTEAIQPNIVVKYVSEVMHPPLEPSSSRLLGVLHCKHMEKTENGTSANSRKVSKAVQADASKEVQPTQTVGRFPTRTSTWPQKFREYTLLESEDSDDEYKPANETRIVADLKPKRKAKPGRPQKNPVAEKNPNGDLETNFEVNSPKSRYKKRKACRISNYKCEVCSKVFSQRGNWRVHLRVHTNERPFVCELCKKGFKSKEALVRHQNTHTGEKPFLCSVCSQGFSSALALKEHQARHTEDYLYECSICQRGFRQISCVKRHLLIHSNEMPFICTICGKKFSQKVYLQSHMRTHTGERPYQCATCNKSFAHLSDLTRHKIIHSGRKPYSCKQCGSAFSDPSSQRRHEREHLKTKSFTCDLCNESFKRGTQLKQHRTKHHHDEVQVILTSCTQAEIPSPAEEDPNTVVVNTAGNDNCHPLLTNDLLPSENDNYALHPDFASQDYYNWLSNFTTLCKGLSIPIANQLFKNISQVHKSIADVLSSPTGILSNKENFQILMNISKDLNNIIDAHLSHVLNTLEAHK